MDRIHFVEVTGPESDSADFCIHFTNRTTAEYVEEELRKQLPDNCDVRLYPVRLYHGFPVNPDPDGSIANVVEFFGGWEEEEGEE